jgi:enoyl-CoA hydratase/carnithine racemase
VIAAVHGHALGAGMAIAACADVIVAADDSVFGIPEIKVGVIGAAAFLGLIVPEKVARYLSLTGESISAREVKAYGGIQCIVPTAEVFDRAMEIAAAISSNAPTGVRYFKEAMNINQNARLVEKYAVESGYTVQFFESPESRESVSAFFEKRMPDFD